MCWKATAGFKRWKSRGAATNENFSSSPKSCQAFVFSTLFQSLASKIRHCIPAGVKRRQCQRTTSAFDATRYLNRSIRRINNTRANPDFPRCVSRQLRCGPHEIKDRDALIGPGTHSVDECCEMKMTRGLSRILHDLFAGRTCELIRGSHTQFIMRWPQRRMTSVLECGSCPVIAHRRH
jgi:hypothetical protein